ncbi:intraflagellar transport 43 isoform X2 [Rhodnius prolixus]|uniref:intraflagellar transport 43 isoform X2 n=1 Tax=Rhodnius prolixus TaxID=13249 RepID=UPI003D18E16F
MNLMKFASQSLSRKDSTSFIDNEKLRSLSPLSREESEDDIPLIPEIDEVQDEDFLGDIAEAPEIPSHIASFTQLNSELKKMAAFTVIDDINLTFLSKYLYQESDLKEGDSRWSWDLLFTEVSSDLRSEWEQQKSPDE